jgi:hypothetical protein
MYYFGGIADRDIAAVAATNKGRTLIGGSVILVRVATKRNGGGKGVFASGGRPAFSGPLGLLMTYLLQIYSTQISIYTICVSFFILLFLLWGPEQFGYRERGRRTRDGPTPTATGPPVRSRPPLDPPESMYVRSTYRTGWIDLR